MQRTSNSQYRDELPANTKWEWFAKAFRSFLEIVMRVPPQVMALLAGLGLILVSIPFSLSRGGILAVAAAIGATLIVARLRPRSQGDNESDQS